MAYDTGPMRSLTQEDPIGLAGGLNLYGLGGGDPVNHSDPFGLMTCCPAVPLFGPGVAVTGATVAAGVASAAVSVGLVAWGLLPVNPALASPTTATAGFAPDATEVAVPSYDSISILQKIRTIGTIIILGNPANTSTGATSGGGGTTEPPAQAQPAKETKPPAEQRPPEDQEE